MLQSFLCVNGEQRDRRIERNKHWMSNPKCMAEHRNEVLIVFSLSLLHLYIHVLTLYQSAQCMLLSTLSFLPFKSWQKLYWSNRNMHAPPVPIKLISIICLKLPLNELFSIAIFVTQLPGKPAAPIISHNKHCYQGSRPYFSHFCQTLSGCSAFWKMNDHYKFRNTFWAMKVKLHQRNFEYWTKTLRILSLFFI